MNDPPRILVVDDNETNRDIIATRPSRLLTVKRRWLRSSSIVPTSFCST
jgi:CheY-like chemotaxis protein